MQIKFWKDNKLDGEHDVDVKKIIKEFLETEDSKLDQPFERLILNFMSTKYGSFEQFTDEEWDALHAEYKKQR